MDVRFARLGQSHYAPIACNQCPNILALSELDPVVLYLEAKKGFSVESMKEVFSRGLVPCKCGGRFCVVDDSRRCSHCKAELKEAQICGQVRGLEEGMRPILGQLYAPPGAKAWANLEFLKSEIEEAAKRYEASPQLSMKEEHKADWLAKEIYDLHFRKMSLDQLQAIVPLRTDLFFIKDHLYHDHGGARSPWWKFWDEDVIRPEHCGAVFDIEQKELKCSSCGESFPAQIR